MVLLKTVYMEKVKWFQWLAARGITISIYKEKQRGCPLLEANKDIHITSIKRYIHNLFVRGYIFEGLTFIINPFN